jgi:kumamolisin
VPITLLSTDGTSTACVYSQGCDDGEQNLDMTQAIGMAPGLASLVMYVGSTDTAMISAMTTHNPLPTTIGCSWGWTPADATTLDPYFLQMSAQGQNFFVASGDDSTWTKNGNAEAWPADDANIVAVGGTDLKTSTPAGPWASETAWSDSGGGSSPDKVALPSYQNVPSVLTGLNNASTTLRNGPDVSANANFTFYTCGDQEACQANYYGGTSFAAPMWAAYIALVNQALVAAKYPTVGFLNPTIYTMNADSTAYATNFHDITSGTSGSYSTALGFDLVTGWGTPTPYLESAIVSTTTNVNTPDFSLTPFSTGYVLTTTPSTPSVTDALTLASINSLAGTVNLTCSGNGGLTCSLSPTSTSLTAKGTASSTLTVNGSAVPVAGTYTVIVTATSGSDVHSASVDVYAPGSALSIADNSSGTITIASPGATGSTTLTLTPSGFVSGATALSCTITSAPTGAINLPTCSVTPSVTLAITTSGTGTLTINTTASHFKSGAQQSSLSVKHTAWLAGGLFLALLLVPVRRRRLPLLAMLFVSALLLSNVVGCSGSAPKGATSGVPGTTAGTYAVTVTGTVGTVTATHTVTINVQ